MRENGELRDDSRGKESRRRRREDGGPNFITHTLYVVAHARATVEEEAEEECGRDNRVIL